MGTWVGYIAKRTQAFITSPTAEMSRWQKVARYAVELSMHCYRELIKDRANQMAAALTYHTLFSLIPTLVLMLVVGKLFIGEVELTEYKNNAIDKALAWLQQSDQSAEPITDEKAAEFAETASLLGEKLDVWVTELQNINLGAIGVVGVVLFIYGATGLVTTIERSFNRIVDTPANRPLHIRLPLYYTLITLGPLMLAFGQYLQNLVFGWLYGTVNTVTDTLGGNVEQSEGVGWLASILLNAALVLSPVAATWVVLAVIYLFLPNTKIKVRAALIGSFVATVGVVLLIELFGMYVRGAAATKIYGRLALLPMFLLWLYLLWLIVLFGLELTHALQSLPAERIKKRKRGEDDLIVLNPEWALPAMTYIADAFAAGKTVTHAQLSQSLAIPASSAQRVVLHLAEHGLLNKITSGRDQRDSYTLARPAEAIALNDVVNASQTLAPQSSAMHVPGTQFFEDAQTEVRRSFEGKTLADAIKDSQGQTDPN